MVELSGGMFSEFRDKITVVGNRKCGKRKYSAAIFLVSSLFLQTCIAFNAAGDRLAFAEHPKGSPAQYNPQARPKAGSLAQRETKQAAFPAYKAWV